MKFACGHERYFPEYAPAIGDEMVCHRCGLVQAVKAYVDEYNWKCSRCNHAKYFNTDKLGMELAAGRHHRRHPDGKMYLRKGAEVYRTWDSIQPELPLNQKEYIPPPF